MKKKIMFILFAFILLFVLSSCTSYPEETRMAKEYLGMTLGEIKELWGSDCTLGGDLFDGAPKGICYADKRTPYIFLFDEEPDSVSSLSDDAVVTRVRAEAGYGTPCENEIFPNSETRTYFDNLSSFTFIVDTIGIEDVSGMQFFLKTENICVEYWWYPYPTYEPFAANCAYDVYIIPEEYQKEVYYFETDEDSATFFSTYGFWPAEDWVKKEEVPYNFYVYYLEYGEFSDMDALIEYSKTGIWPENAYVPAPYDDLEFVYFRGEYDFWPPDNWDYLPIDPASGTYYNDYGEWADPEAYEEFMETGHWPEDAFVPYPFSDPELLNEYNRTGEWPEGTDLSALPEKTQWEE